MRVRDGVEHGARGNSTGGLLRSPSSSGRTRGVVGISLGNVSERRAERRVLLGAVVRDRELGRSLGEHLLQRRSRRDERGGTEEPRGDFNPGEIPPSSVSG